MTGFILTFYYVPHSTEAFFSSDFLRRELDGGYTLRILHLNGASLFFFFIYCHIARGILYNRTNQRKTWFSGVIIYLMAIGIAFLGYVLPWGQISFWGASVITNLVATVPVVGTKLVLWIWGGFNVNKATLSLFFTLHYLIPLILIIFVFVHILFLHEYGRTRPQKIHLREGKVSFGEYFLIKDILNTPIILTFFSLSFLSPWILGDPENWIPANPIKRPVHIQPEWYFLFAYGILRRVPNKLGGVVCLLLRVLILVILPIKKKIEQRNRLIHKYVLGILGRIFMSLTWLGGCRVEAPFILAGQVYRILYFGFFFFYIFC
jgi:ubiquinol-cytochrome c reductase cytochrome b subunit